jgi:hypothetical protein
MLIESMEEQGQGGQQITLALNKIEDSLKIFLPQLEIRIEPLVNLMFCTTALYILAVITFPHWESSHYSDTKNIKPKDYTEDMPLVKQLPRIQSLTESAIESLEKQFKNIKVG